MKSWKFLSSFFSTLIFLLSNKTNAFKNLIQEYLHQVEKPRFSVEQAQIYEDKITEHEILATLKKTQ